MDICFILWQSIWFQSCSNLEKNGYKNYPDKPSYNIKMYSLASTDRPRMIQGAGGESSFKLPLHAIG